MACMMTCVIAMAFLLLSTLTPTHFMVQGRQFSRLSDAAVRINQDKVEETRIVIGSKPPRCDEMCRSCGHCEAIQVPAVPAKKFYKRNHKFLATPIATAYSRGDDTSNYKPMCWKCKCGHLIFNPW